MRTISNVNDPDLEPFRTLIVARLKTLEADNARGQDGQKTVELDQQSVGRLSRMDALQNQAMAMAQQDRRNLEARKLTAALARIETAEFGYCLECGDEIGMNRLMLDPTVVRCISCARG